MAPTIVFYFSATNTTKRIAAAMARQLGADLQEIHPQTPYSAANLNWHNPQARALVEQEETGLRVPVIANWPSIDHYQNIIIGHPLWSGLPPRVISTVIDQLDLTGKNLATFATSGGSTYARLQRFIEQLVQENHYDLRLNQE